MIDFHPESDASHRRLLDRMIDKYRSSHPDASDAQLDSIDAERHVAGCRCGWPRPNARHPPDPRSPNATRSAIPAST